MSFKIQMRCPKQIQYLLYDETSHLEIGTEFVQYVTAALLKYSS